LPPDQLKNKKFYKFHNATSYSTRTVPVRCNGKIMALPS